MGLWSIDGWKRFWSCATLQWLKKVEFPSSRSLFDVSHVFPAGPRNDTDGIGYVSHCSWTRHHGIWRRSDLVLHSNMLPSLPLVSICGGHALYRLLMSHKYTIALFTFDTLLTVSNEVKNVWSKKHRLGSILYLLARYTTLFSLIWTVCLNTVNGSLQVCNQRDFC